jgi:hypothetical protein
MNQLICGVINDSVRETKKTIQITIKSVRNVKAGDSHINRYPLVNQRPFNYEQVYRSTIQLSILLVIQQSIIKSDDRWKELKL